MLYEAPDNAFAATFISENNVLIGKIKSVNGEMCEIQVGEQVVKANPVNIGNVGEDSTLSLRPERVELNPDSAEFPNIFEGEVEELIYLAE